MALSLILSPLRSHGHHFVQDQRSPGRCIPPSALSHPGRGPWVLSTVWPLPGVAPFPSLWLWCPPGEPFSAPLPASKAAPFKSADRAQLSVPANSYEFGRNSRGSQAALIPVFRATQSPLSPTPEAPAGDLVSLQVEQSSRREDRWLSR